ncbi:hypothetical protein ACFQGE_01720 [Halomicroarcula sp. GCM10025817]|uniref:hypothetical protein n=1 Tax=Haloarcula TaxID=2237 RepID=UPI0023E8A91D|nr:hypothetical protein [Halomicroarcula sp. SYNS111]
MTDGEDRRVVLALVVPELVGLSLLLVLLGLSLTGRTTFAATYPFSLRLAAFAFVLVELLIPVGVYLDVRRRPDDPDLTWVHAAAVPVVNVFGVVAYLEERRRALGESGA